MSITGFAHKGRGVGVRDHQLILPSVVCSTHVSRKIANEVGALTKMVAELLALMCQGWITSLLS
jgi:altronate dehydratase